MTTCARLIWAPKSSSLPPGFDSWTTGADSTRLSTGSTHDLTKEQNLAAYGVMRRSSIPKLTIGNGSSYLGRLQSGHNSDLTKMEQRVAVSWLLQRTSTPDFTTDNGNCSTLGVLHSGLKIA